MGPVGQIDNITKLIRYARSLMKVEWQSSDTACRTFCTIVGDYSGHMGFATDPPFCTAYPLSFVHKDDPAQMTFRSQQNHPTSFTADVLLVRQLLACGLSPMWVRNGQTCRRCLLIPRGVHFLPDLFPQIIIPRDHVAPYRNPQMGEDVPFVTVGPFMSMDTLFPGTAGDLELFTDEEVIALSNVGVLKSPITGTSTPKLPSLASKMEPDSSTRKQDYRNSPRSHRHPVSMAAGSCEDLDKSEHKCEASMQTTSLRDWRWAWLPQKQGFDPWAHNWRWACSPTLKHGGSIDTGASGEHPCPKERCTERGRSHKHRCINSPECLPPPLFLSTPATPCHATTGSLCIPSFDMSRGSLPLDRGGMDTEVPVSSAGMVTPSSACQLVLSSGQLMNAQVDSVIATSGLTEAQSEEIFLLSCEVQTLHGKLALDFIQLSNQEALFCMGAKGTGYEKATREHPDCSLDKRDKVTRRSGEAAWLDTNSLPFCHALEYQNNMIELITRSQEAIQALHEHIWKVVCRVMESAGKSVADGLGIALHLVDMLPTIPLQLTFTTVTARLPRCTPKAHAHAPPPGTDQGAMTVLGKEILKSACGAEEKAMQPTWLVTATGAGSVKVMMVESEGGNYPNCPRTSLSPALHVSTSTGWHTTRYQTPCSPSYSAYHSPSWDLPSRSLRLRPHSSDSSVSGFGSSSPSESGLDKESDTGSSGGDSGSPEWYCSSSPDVIFLGKNEEDPADAEGEKNGSNDEEALSLLDISNSDNEEACKAAAHNKACQSDVLYATWQDRQIRQGNDDIAQHDQRVCDHTDIGKCCEAPDEIGPPLTYMEECGDIKPVEAINNPMGLCRFYRMNPKKSNVLTGPKLADCAHKIQGMVEMAKRVRWLLTVIVFEGESVTPMCQLQELHSCLTLSHIAIHTPEEAKVGVKNCMYCLPICAYVVKNDLVFLNHIIVGHYWGSFSCRKCLAFMAVMVVMAVMVKSPRWSVVKCVPCAAECQKCIAAPGPVAGLGRQRREQTRKGLAWWHGRGHTVHQQSPFWQSPPRSRLPTLWAADTLRVVVCARWPPSPVTSRHLRSTRNQCPECSPMCTNSVWYAIMSGCVGCISWCLSGR